MASPRKTVPLRRAPAKSSLHLVEKQAQTSLSTNATKRKVAVMAPPVITIDFETEPIKRRPLYPPKPTSVAIKYPTDKKAKSYAWGHPEGNNCTEAEGFKAVRAAWAYAKKHKIGLLFTNGKFDIDIAETHCGVERLHWSQYHELQFLLFYNNPHSFNLQLKSQGRELLGIDPGEKDEVTDWLKAHYKGKEDPRDWAEGYEPGSGRTPKRIKWYAYACLVPGDMAGRLAVADVSTTELLFKHLFPIVIGKGKMQQAYERDQQLMPILLENEREGVRTDIDLLRSDEKLYSASLIKADDWLHKAFHKRAVKMRLSAATARHMLTFNINSDDEFGEALATLKLVDDDAWVWTKGGINTAPKRSVSKKNLKPEMVNDPQVASVYGYRNRLITCLGTFLRPWLRQAEATLAANGVATIHTNWKQVKASDFGGGDAGAATGRLSSSPNFQNIPKAMEDRGDGYVHPAFAKLPPLPLMRKYLMPDEGHVWGHRDYSQQELRVFAHYAESMTEEGVKSLAQMYRENPKLDVHGIVDKGLREEGLEFIRTFVKNFVFQTLYGGGVPAVTAALHTTDAIARRAIQALKDYLPGYDALNDDIKSMAKDEGLPLRTWGGRLYYVEEPRYVPEHGRVMSFEYKLLNYLIQGSSADCTKEAIIRYHNHPKRQARFLITVHDEINISIPKHRVKEELEILRECMESIEFDVPMLSEPKVGPRWSEAKKMEIAA